MSMDPQNGKLPSLENPMLTTLSLIFCNEPTPTEDISRLFLLGPVKKRKLYFNGH